MGRCGGITFFVVVAASSHDQAEGRLMTPSSVIPDLIGDPGLMPPHPNPLPQWGEGVIRTRATALQIKAFFYEEPSLSTILYHSLLFRTGRCDFVDASPVIHDVQFAFFILPKGRNSYPPRPEGRAVVRRSSP